MVLNGQTEPDYKENVLMVAAATATESERASAT